ncbi:hypothetical protein NM208_g2347 [Fusarium decemcellulare]|uniref:Uncharacterized protein n=1 Tax=Fusarium decemcellulare TaxID=57161 RepID=A0ACC1SST6_9HYPO|nr:hypothetical protein NM208_g2347 [Fusarium decemcellulare]
MKEAIVYPDISVEIQDVPVPTPGPSEVLIKVVFSGVNPKDWKRPTILNTAFNSGDDIAGYIATTGRGVTEFHAGDRVAAMHGATIPLAALTAAMALGHELRLPLPWSPSGKNGHTPLVIYGASTSVGCFAIKLARAASIGPIIAVAGKSRTMVQALLNLEAGDRILDYNQRPAKLVEEIRQSILEANQGPCWHGIDCASYSWGREFVSPLAEALGMQNEVQGTGRLPKLVTIDPGATGYPMVHLLKVVVAEAHNGTEEKKRGWVERTKQYTVKFKSGKYAWYEVCY